MRFGAKTVALGGLAALALFGTAMAAEADNPFGREHRQFGGRWNALSADDRAAFADARIAALHAGLRLRPEQEQLWPPVETAIRDLGTLRREQRLARRDRAGMADDAPGALRAMADAATARGQALRKLADATAPLFATLDPDQKRRALALARPMRPHGGHHRGRRGPDDGR